MLIEGMFLGYHEQSGYSTAQPLTNETYFALINTNFDFSFCKPTTLSIVILIYKSVFACLREFVKCKKVLYRVYS